MHTENLRKKCGPEDKYTDLMYFLMWVLLRMVILLAIGDSAVDIDANSVARVDTWLLVWLMICCGWHAVVNICLMWLTIQMVILLVIGDLDTDVNVKSGGSVDIGFLM